MGALVLAVAISLGCASSGAPSGGGAGAPRPIERGIDLRYRIDGAEGQQAVLETTAVLARRCAAVGVERFRLSMYGEGRFGITLAESEAGRLPRLKTVLGMQGDLRLQVAAVEQDAAEIEAILRRKEGGEYGAADEPFDVVAFSAGGAGAKSLLVENGEGRFYAPLADAYPTRGPLQEPAVGFTWDETAAEQFGDFTERHVGRALAIILDGEARSLPVIEERIGASGRITGTFTEEDVRDLVLVLRAGPLPSKPVLESETTFGPEEAAPPFETGASKLKE